MFTDQTTTRIKTRQMTEKNKHHNQNEPNETNLKEYNSISQLQRYLLFTQKITDLDGLVSVGDARVDGKVSVHEPHLVAVALGDAGDEVLDVTESSTDRSRGLPRSEPGLNLQLPLASGLFSDEIKV